MPAAQHPCSPWCSSRYHRKIENALSSCRIRETGHGLIRIQVDIHDVLPAGAVAHHREVRYRQPRSNLSFAPCILTAIRNPKHVPPRITSRCTMVETGPTRTGACASNRFGTGVPSIARAHFTVAFSGETSPNGGLSVCNIEQTPRPGFTTMPRVRRTPAFPSHRISKGNSR